MFACGGRRRDHPGQVLIMSQPGSEHDVLTTEKRVHLERWTSIQGDYVQDREVVNACLAQRSGLGSWLGEGTEGRVWVVAGVGEDSVAWKASSG